MGYLPFGEGEEDPYEIFLAIQKQKLTFPKNFNNKEMKKLIKLLLNKESWNRPDHRSIRNSEYFRDVTDEEWSNLEKGVRRPPNEIMNLIEGYIRE